MSDHRMDCAEIRDALLAGTVPSGPAVDAHRRTCEACSELLDGEAALGKALSTGETRGFDGAELWASLDSAVRADAGPRGYLRSRATPVRLGIAAAVAGGVVAVGGRPAEHAPPFQQPIAWLVVFALAALACLGALFLPLGRPRPPAFARGALVFGALALPLAYALAAPASSSAAIAAAERGFAAQALGCFVYGALLTLPFVVVVWALERSDRPWLAIATGAAAAAGLVANAALALHCPNTDAAHLALGHATIGMVLAAAGALGTLVAFRKFS
jgi:hypothetical protein